MGTGSSVQRAPSPGQLCPDHVQQYTLTDPNSSQVRGVTEPSPVLFGSPAEGSWGSVDHRYLISLLFFLAHVLRSLESHSAEWLLKANEWTKDWQRLRGFRRRTVIGKTGRVRGEALSSTHCLQEERKGEAQVDC